ncbi:MAG: hypothetical protein Q9162_005677 [Coniocarpon cinnabarinum]
MQRQTERQYVDEDEPPSSPGLVDQVREAHANAIPGVTRPEEGEDQRERPTIAQRALNRNYSDIEARRERDRYAAYLDEQDSEKLPNAFDHGWKQNLQHVFGESKLLWFLPICNTTGDGWNWQASSKWQQAREEVAQERRAQEREEQAFRQEDHGWVRRAPAVDFRNDTLLGQRFGEHLKEDDSQSDYSMKSLPSRQRKHTIDAEDPTYSSEDSGEDNDHASRTRLLPNDGNPPRGQWNDLPEDMMSSRSPKRNFRSSRSPRPARAYPKG